MRNKFTIVMTLVIASIFTGQPPASGGEKKAEELAPLKVQATRGGGAGSSIPASISVISREEIQKKQYQRVEDILREGLGLDVVRTGPAGSNATVFMRGAGSSSTLVMIDGIQVNLNSTGAFNFANLTADNVERIEVLRGPQSTLWGADAVGGVINIVTKRGKGDPAHGFAVEGGSYGAFKETASSSGEIKAFDYSLSVSRTDSDGFSTANVNRGNTERDGYENTAVSARTGVNFLEDGRAEFIGHFIKSRNEFDAFSFTTGLPVDGLNFSNNESFYIALPLSKSAARWWDVKFTPSVSYDQLRTDDPSFGNSAIFNRTYTLDLQNNVELNKFLSVIFGAEYQKLNADLPDQPISKDIETQGYFLQNVFNYEDRLVVTGGFRHDVNSAFQDKTTYKVEAGYRFKETGTRIRGAKATGFRAPTINDLYFPNFSNPNLKPEESDGWEAGFDQDLFAGRLRIGSTFFDSDLTNLIQFDSATLMPQNIGSATSRGIETYAALKIVRDLSLSLSHTWNDTLDQNRQKLRRRAENKFAANFHYDWRDKFGALLGIIYKSGINDGTFSADDYTLVRTALSYQVLKNIKLTVRIENIFDKQYEEIPGFGVPGRSAFGGFIFNF